MMFPSGFEPRAREDDGIAFQNEPQKSEEILEGHVEVDYGHVIIMCLKLGQW